jgi:hypothetical protein
MPTGINNKMSLICYMYSRFVTRRYNMVVELYIEDRSFGHPGVTTLI